MHRACERAALSAAQSCYPARPPAPRAPAASPLAFKDRPQSVARVVAEGWWARKPTEAATLVGRLASLEVITDRRDHLEEVSPGIGEKRDA
jgi:hypothetical protein